MQTTLLVVGILALLTGVLLLVQRVRTMASGARAEGRIVGHSESTVTSDRTGGTQFSKVYAPIVQFEHAGKKVRFTSTLGTADKAVEGSPVPVRYMPADPAGTAEIATPTRMWGFPAVALVAGVVLLLLSRGMDR